jgi:YggT family protein
LSLGIVKYWIVNALWLYEMCIFAYALMSWFTGLGGVAVQIHSFLATICEPFVGMIRRVLPRQISGGAGIDLSPLVAMLVLIVAQNVIRGF